MCHYFYRIQYSAITKDTSLFLYEQISDNKYYNIAGFNPVI